MNKFTNKSSIAWCTLTPSLGCNQDGGLLILTVGGSIITRIESVACVRSWRHSTRGREGCQWTLPRRRARYSIHVDLNEFGPIFTQLSTIACISLLVYKLTILSLLFCKTCRLFFILFNYIFLSFLVDSRSRSSSYYIFCRSSTSPSKRHISSQQASLITIPLLSFIFRLFTL